VKLHRTPIGAGRNAFTAYGDGWFALNGERRTSSLIVLPDRVLAWDVPAFAALGAEHIARLLPLEPEIVLLGTGARQRFLRPELARLLTEARIGLEVMDLRAACRTFNILAAEDRRVAAALLLS
jgi:uncharacterized protein